MKLEMNAACVADPALIVMPSNAEDVSVALLVARSASMQVSVRGGGHSYTCNSVKNNSLHIDMRNINNIQLTSDSRSSTGLAAVLGAGATWGQANKLSVGQPKISRASPCLGSAKASFQ